MIKNVTLIRVYDENGNIYPNGYSGENTMKNLKEKYPNHKFRIVAFAMPAKTNERV